MEKQSQDNNYGLPPEEVNQLIKSYQEQEDEAAQQKLVENYTKLVESLAYRYSRGQSHHEDLVQVGMLGLLGAIRRFDTSFERRFEVLEAMEMGQSYNALSVDHSIEADKDGSTVTLLDVMGQADDNYDLAEKRMILEKVLPILSEREQEIIHSTFIDGLSQKETGERIGLSQMHVSRLQRSAIKKLREAVKEVE